MDINLFSLMETFGTEDECRKVLEELRWPNGVACPRCGSLKHQHDTKRNTYDCAGCGYQFSVLAGSVFHDTKLPLRKWFVATYLMCESKKGMSANQLKRTLGVSYKTAWYLCHRIRVAMGDVARSPLSGTVETDETFVGGEYRYSRTDRRPDGSPRRGPRPDSNKTIVLGALQRGGDVRFRITGDRAAKTLKTFLDSEVADAADAIYTDDWGGYRTITFDEDTRHETVNHSAKEYVRGDVHTNGIESVWSLLKRSIIGSYHQVSAKHLDLYLDELEWRFNNRDNASLFPDTLKALLSAETLEYKALIAAE